MSTKASAQTAVSVTMKDEPNLVVLEPAVEQGSDLEAQIDRLISLIDAWQTPYRQDFNLTC